MVIRRVSSSAARSTASSHPVLRIGARGTAVRELQTRLRAAGQNVTVDGVFGPGTLNSVRAFQRKNGLSADGVVGPATWGKLSGGAPAPRAPAPAAGSSGGSGPTLRSGSRGPAVKALQQRLTQLGFNTKGADGGFGPNTAAAVRAFQRSRGLGADGVVGPATWNKLGIKVAGGASSGGVSGGGAVGGSAPTGPSKVVTGYSNGRPFSLRVSHVGGGKYMATKAAGPYMAMIAAARRAGINLSNTSGYRTNSEQAALYRRYGAGRAARPGYSNHQQGLSMDIGGVNGYGTRAFNWLKANGPKFGFINDVRGEFWHFTYKR